MEFNEFLKFKKQTLISFLVIFLIIGTVFTFTQTFKYGARSKVLVIQEGASGIDPFAVSRSVEYLSNLFSQVVYSSSFFDMVLESDFNIDKNYFKGDSISQLKIWRKTVGARSVENSGIIIIDVYHPSSYQAKQIALAVNHILMTQNANYQGIGTSVKITVIDEPLVSNYPTQPNLPMNFGIIIAFSLLFGLVYIYVFPEEKYNIYLFGRRKPKKGKNANEVLQQDFLHSEAHAQPQRPAEPVSGHREVPHGSIRNILK